MRKSSLFAGRVNPHITLQLESVDTAIASLEFARYNVRAATNRHANPEDSMDIRLASWDKVLNGKSCLYDVLYFNPPYLKSGERVREEFKGMPLSSMFVAGGDQLVHYRSVVPRIITIMKPRGFAFIRTPREQTAYEAVLALTKGALQNHRAVTLHSITTATEFGERKGKGIVLEFNVAQPTEYRVEPIRAIGLALTRKALAHSL